MQQVGVKESELHTYECLPILAYFLVELEEKFIESQRFSTLDFVLKVTPTRWWGTHKKSISKWSKCKRLLHNRFGEEINYSNQI